MEYIFDDIAELIALVILWGVLFSICKIKKRCNKK